MGYLPKHIKVRHERLALRTIAHAALAGAVIVKQRIECIDGSHLPDRYLLRYADGQESNFFDRRSEAAAQYLWWWFDKNNMWPRYK